MKQLLDFMMHTNSELIEELFYVKNLKLRFFLNKLNILNDFNQLDRLISTFSPRTMWHRGSSRIVIPINNKKVLKIAYNETGIIQNLNETHINKHLPTYYKRFIAKILEVGKSYKWVIQERVDIIERNSDFIFKQKKLFQHLLELDAAEGDLDQIGMIGQRTVIYDYGLTQSLYDSHYS